MLPWETVTTSAMSKNDTTVAISGGSGDGEMAERAGFEAQVIDLQGLTTIGQGETSSGQKLSNLGHDLGIAAFAYRSDRTDTGQTTASAGQNSALKSPQNFPASSQPIPKGLAGPIENPIDSMALAEILELVRAWKNIPGPVKVGIMAMVHATGIPGPAKEPE